MKIVVFGILTVFLIIFGLMISSFTNIPELAFEKSNEIISKIEVTNPIDPYEINTECDLKLFLFKDRGFEQRLYSFASKNQVLVEQKYQEYLDQRPDSSNEPSLEESHNIINNILSDIMIEEYSINPQLSNSLKEINKNPLSTYEKQKIKTGTHPCMNDSKPTLNDEHCIAKGLLDSFVPVLSGSMTPTLNVFDNVELQCDVPFEDIEVGDVIAFHHYGRDGLITVHRVVSIFNDEPLTFQTKGDANYRSLPGVDYIKENQYIGKALINEPIQVKKVNTEPVDVSLNLDFVESDNFRTLAFNALPGKQGHNPEIKVKRGDVVKITTTNLGKSFHAFGVTKEAEGFSGIIPGTEIASVSNTLKPGESGEVIFTAKEPGKYYYICTVPGHRMLGMQGTFIVE